MTTHLNTTFRDSIVVVDGNEYRGCNFVRCRMVYRGGHPPSIADCLFEDPRWVFEGAAGSTLALLRALYHGMGEGGVRLIEDTFRQIRTPPG